MADDVQIQFGANVSGAISGTKQVGAALDALQTPATEVANDFKQLGNSAEQAADKTDNLSRVMGTLKNAIAGVAVYKLAKDLVSMTSNVVTAGIEMQALENRMRSATGSNAVAAESIRYVREEADRLGLVFTTVAENYASFSASALRSGLTIGETRRVFRGVSEAAAAMGLSAERQSSVFQALSQMASKGVVSMEELRQQLGESLPGALQIFAASMGVSTGEFIKMVEAGKVLTPDLVKLGDEMHNQFGQRAVQASQNAQGEINRLRNAMFELKVEVMDDGSMGTFTQSIRDLTTVLQDPAVREGLQNLMTLFVDIAAAAVKAAAAIGSVALAVNQKIEQGGNSLFGALFGQEGIDAIQAARAKRDGKPVPSKAAASGPMDMVGAQAMSNATDLLDALKGNSYTMGAKQTTSASDKDAKSRVGTWEADIAKRLYADQVYFDKARDMELQFWQEKLNNANLSAKEREAIEKRVYAMQQGVYQQEINAYMASLDAKQAAAKRDFDEVMRIQQEKLDYLKKWYGEDSAQYQNELARKSQLETQHLLEIERRYKTVFTTISNTFTGAIKGMVTGTKTLQQSILGILDGLFSAFLDYIARMVVEWAVAEVMKTSATAAGEAARTSTVAAGAAAQGAVQTAYQGKSIMGSAATTYAGVFANMSPALGPFAAVPAGIAAAVVGAQAALLPSFAVGAWELPGDTVAQLHKGEMVVPRTFAESLRENGTLGGMGGGGDMQVSISAVDAKSVQRLFRQNGGAMTAALRNQVRNYDRNTRRGGNWKG